MRAADRDLGAQRVERVLDFLPRLPHSAAGQHVAGDRALGRLAEDGLLVAEAQRQAEADRFAARLLGQQRHLHAVRECYALRAQVEIGGRWIERLARRGRGVTLVVLHERRDVHRRRHRRAVRLGIGKEFADGEVRALEIGERDALHIRRRHGAIAVAPKEEQTPVAERDVFGNGHAERLRVGEHVVVVLGGFRAHARDFGFGDRLLRDTLDRREHGFTRRLDGLPIRYLREERHRAGIDAGYAVGVDRSRFLGFHQRLVEAARRSEREDVAKHVDGDRVRVRATHGMEHHADELGVADPPQRGGTLAVLDRLLRIDRRQRARGFGNGPEVSGDQRQRRVHIELAGDDQHGVVRLVIQFVERLQPADVDVLDIRARADRHVSVVVPLVGSGQHLAEQHVGGVVLAVLELVADHGHLGVEVAPADERIHHPVGLHRQRPVEVVAGRGERLEVIGAVPAGAAVEAHAAAAELLHDVAAIGRALEHEVLEQVRHPGLAVILVRGADAVRDVDHRRRLRCVREQQHREPVGEPVLGDPLHARPLRDTRGKRGVGADGDEQGDEERRDAAQPRIVVEHGKAGLSCARGSIAPARLTVP